jgi:peptidoglycan/LPS O-acetylase OafA/YrhL
MGAATPVAAAARSDIQALRGLAVLLVILQHAKAGVLPAGYLGVDIFFVISGFLITGILAREQARGGIRLGAFYFRRARRLLPAALVTFAITTLLAYFLLDAVEWRDFTRQLAGAVTFTANVVLLDQTGYFAHAAELKPLLHVWSLAVEEQFYLVLPAVLLLAPRRAWPPVLALVLVASLALCLHWEATRPDAAFYLLPARAWELALGALVALWPAQEAARNALVRRLFLPALLALLVVPAWPHGLPRVAGMAIVCLATAVVIIRRHPALDDRPIPNALARVGDASYSLYLVHWPVFAFLNNAYAGDPSFGTPSTAVLGACVALALLLGFALHRWVEQPCRHRELRFPRRWIAMAVAASALLAIVPSGIAARSTRMTTDGSPGLDFVALRQDNLGFGAACEGYRRFEAPAACRNAASPRLLAWGDSFAMHLVDGLAATAPGGVLQATKSACGPLLGIAQVTGAYNHEYARNCIEFNDSVMAYLEAAPGIDTVVLSAAFFPYFDPQRRLLVREGEDLVERDPDMEVALAGLAATVRRIRAAGKRVVVVAPPPGNGFDYTHCIERRMANRNPFRALVDCDIPEPEYRASKRGVLAFLQRAERDGVVEVVSLEPALCDGRVCRTMLGETVVYRDEGHLSHAGSVAVARALGLGAEVRHRAR